MQETAGMHHHTWLQPALVLHREALGGIISEFTRPGPLLLKHISWPSSVVAMAEHLALLAIINTPAFGSFAAPFPWKAKMCALHVCIFTHLYVCVRP